MTIDPQSHRQGSWLAKETRARRKELNSDAKRMESPAAKLEVSQPWCDQPMMTALPHQT
jgi:hypothetical protein